MKSNSFALQKLSIGREGVAFAAPITLSLDPGELLAVEGANGSGKSTLLKTIAGLLAPLSGEILWHGPQPLYMGHRGGMLPEMSVRENVAYWANMHGTPELIATAMHYFDLGYYAEMPLASLSAGWQHRVALTRLITCGSSLWLLDEAMANLDKEGIALLQSLIQTRLEQGGIAILTSHIPLDGPQVKHLKLDDSIQSFREDN